MNALPQKKRIFPDITGVSRNQSFLLANAGMIDSNNTVVSWTYLNPFLRDSILTEPEAKRLILLELYRTDGQPVRTDIVDRLVLYLAKRDREGIRSKISKELSNRA